MERLFQRLNRGAVGNAGFMEFRKVRGPMSPFLDGTVRSKVRAGLGPFLPSSYTRGIWGHHQWISVPICVGSYVCIRRTLVMVADTHELRSAFDVLMQCRMLPMLLESFVGTFLSPYLERVQI